MKKRCLVMMLILFCCFSTIPVAWADTVVPDTLEDGRPFEEPFVLPIKTLKFMGPEIKTEQPPLLIDGEYLLLPIRAAGEALGWAVSWNDASQSVILSNKEDTPANHYQETIITIKIGEKKAEVDYGRYFRTAEEDSKPKHATLDFPVAAYLVNGVAMVPKEVLSEYMQCSVLFSHEIQEAYIYRILSAGD